MFNIFTGWGYSYHFTISSYLLDPRHNRIVELRVTREVDGVDVLLELQEERGECTLHLDRV